MLIVMILMRLWLALSLSAAAPVPPIVEKEAKEDTASVDIVNGDGIIDIVNGDDINSDALHSHSSENTNRYPRNIYIGGDVHIEIEGDNNQINLGSIFGEDASQDDHTMSPRFQAIDGGWTSYGSCTKTCKGGVKKRTCTNPAPQHGGKPCTGDASVPCNQNIDCAVDGGWSNWSEYGQCSKSCGGGQQTRTRTCTNPVPHHNGRTCEQQNIGDPTETKDCNRHNCVCTAGKVNQTCFCDNGQEGGQDCAAEQVCTYGGACLDGDGVSECFTAEGCPLVQNNLITTLMELKKEFHITFEFQPTQYISGWQNVLFMTTSGNDDKKVVLWVKDDGQLHPWFTANTILTEEKYPIGQWHSVEFSQQLEDSQYFYRVKINGVEVEVVNNEPNIFFDVKVYASGPGTNALKGSLRNLVITMEQGDAAKEETGCGFNDNDVITTESTNSVANAYNFVKVESWYKWKEGKIPYYFKGSIIAGDKNLIQDVMNEIEQHTCFEFILHDTEPLGHHLEIVVESNSCVSGFSAYVTPNTTTKILLHSYFQFTDVGYCGNHRGKILHEMMHVFGIMHTHKRNDRDHYITVYQNNIDDMYKSQFKKCEDCKTYRQIPYECDSIMHYGYGICAKKSYGAKTMSAKDPFKCRLSESGAQTPTKNDWKLLTIIGVQVCGPKKLGYGSLGCWRDIKPRAIASLEGLDSRLKGNFKERINAVEICFEVAKSRGYPIFAVQDGGECCGSSTAMLNYKKYEPADNCGADGKGGWLANEVYNIQGSCEVNIGRSETETKNFIWATVSEGCECPAEVDKNNWLGGYDNTDKFLVTQTGQELKVQRTDNPGGWLIPLAFMCVIRGSCEVYVGKSDSNIKRATVEEGCKCQEEVNIDKSVGGQNKVLKFAVTQNGKILKVQRMDSNGGWEMDLDFNCKHTGNLIIPSLKQLRIEIHKLKNVVNGVKKEQVEDLQKSSMDEKEKESITNLNTATEYLKKYCSRSSEHEDCQSKQILVSEKEIEQINKSVNQDITGNRKIGKEFLINLKEKLEELDGAATEAQQSWKHQTGCVIEENINYFGNNLHSEAKKSDSFYQCSKLCGTTEGCKYWTQSEQNCWLKDSDSGKNYHRDAISGVKDCPKGDYLTETMRILIATIKELKKMVNGLGRDDKIEKSDDETELLNIMDELTRNLKNHCTNKNGICKSEELLTLIKKLESIFEKIKETGKISSGFLVNLEEFAENLVLAAENSHNFIIEGPTSFTECKSGTDCSCGSEICTEGQICTDAKCLNECEVKKGEELLTEDCFCPDKEEGQLCEGGIDICTEHGCLDTSHHAIFILFFG